MARNATKPTFILTGSIAIDRIMSFSGLFEEAIKPDKLHVLSLSVLLDNLVDTHGGTAANIAYNMALLGEKPVLLGSLGKNGTEYMQKLEKLGINTDFVHYSELPTATFTVLTDQNDCQVGGFFPGAMSDTHIAPLKEIEASFVVISAHNPEVMRQQCLESKTEGFRVCYDPGQQVSNVSGEDLKLGVESAEVLILNDYEMDVLLQKTEMTLEKVLSQVPIVIITLGEEGCLLYDKNAKELKPLKVKAVSNLKVVDPTGAGDAFRAGFLYGYVKGYSMKESLQLGCVVAAFAVEHKGTQMHTFSWLTIQERYQQTYGSSILPQV
jgi:adenosine kinase